MTQMLQLQVAVFALCKIKQDIMPIMLAKNNVELTSE
jgi:hypothetical protein